jgi:hypothetical protein
VGGIYPVFMQIALQPLPRAFRDCAKLINSGNVTAVSLPCVEAVEGALLCGSQPYGRNGDSSDEETQAKCCL